MAKSFKNWVSDSFNRTRRRWRYRFLFSFGHEVMPEPSVRQTIDVVIPVIEKDLDVLPLCVEGVRRQVSNPLDDIYLVGRGDSDSLRDAARDLGCLFKAEEDVLSYGPKQIAGARTVDGADRRGWIFQQLLKLSGAIGSTPRFLVIDADHVLVSPHTFVSADNRLVLYQSKEYHGAYFRSIYRLLGHIKPDSLSFVAHKMIFDRGELARLRDALVKRNPSLGKNWDEIIVNSLNMSEGASPFSEYEMYGNFIPSLSKIKLLWREKALVKTEAGLPEYDELVRQYGGKYRSVTFPDYMAHKKSHVKSDPIQ